MISKAVLRYIRITPRKFRLVIPLIKGKNPEEAIAILQTVKRGASKYAVDLLTSAIANAKRADQGIDVSTLYISKMIADCGPTLKRFRAGSMGRASTIRKRMSHLTVELDQKKPHAHEHKQKEHAAHAHKAAEHKNAKIKTAKEHTKIKNIAKGKK
jgi:large subunit ribosomal protein L22